VHVKLCKYVHACIRACIYVCVCASDCVYRFTGLRILRACQKELHGKLRYAYLGLAVGVGGQGGGLLVVDGLCI